jgi:hypothetical protein
LRNAVADETGKAARWFHFAVAMIWEKARLGKRIAIILPLFALQALAL